MSPASTASPMLPFTSDGPLTVLSNNRLGVNGIIVIDVEANDVAVAPSGSIPLAVALFVTPSITPAPLFISA